MGKFIYHKIKIKLNNNHKVPLCEKLIFKF